MTTRITDLDLIIGRRVREIRLERGIDSKTLCKHLGITGQQLSKYEKALNRVSATSLYKISQFLRVPLLSFYDQDSSPYIKQDMKENTLMGLIKALDKIPAASRKYLVKFLEALNDTDSTQELDSSK